MGAGRSGPTRSAPRRRQAAAGGLGARALPPDVHLRRCPPALRTVRADPLAWPTDSAAATLFASSARVRLRAPSPVILGPAAARVRLPQVAQRPGDQAGARRDPGRRVQPHRARGAAARAGGPPRERLGAARRVGRHAEVVCTGGSRHGRCGVTLHRVVEISCARMLTNQLRDDTATFNLAWKSLSLARSRALSPAGAAGGSLLFALCDEERERQREDGEGRWRGRWNERGCILLPIDSPHPRSFLALCSP